MFLIGRKLWYSNAGFYLHIIALHLAIEDTKLYIQVFHNLIELLLFVRMTLGALWNNCRIEENGQMQMCSFFI